MTDFYFLGLVLKNLDVEDEVLAAWAKAGSSGITSLDCEGQSLREHAFRRDDMPLFPSLSSLMSNDNVEQKFLFTIVKGNDQLKHTIDLTQQITGDLNQPGRGVLFAWPLTTVIGLA